MGDFIHRLVERVEPHVRGTALAAGMFRPNIVRFPEGGFFDLVAIPLNSRREQRAMDSGLALASSSFVVVTPEDVYVFDGWLLQWKGVRLVLQHRRDDLVVRPVPLAQPRPPAEAWPQCRETAALRIEDGAGHALAELEPWGWGPEVKNVFRVLTGYEGWPPETGETTD